MQFTLDGEFDIEMGAMPPTPQAPEGSLLLTFRDKASTITIVLGIPKLQAMAFGRRVMELSGGGNGAYTPEPVYGPSDDEAARIIDKLGDSYDNAVNEGE